MSAIALLKKHLGKASTTSWRSFTSSVVRDADFTHTVIGGGAVGLAIARKLAQRDGTSTLLVERNGAVGMETSSRNSEVIHAGLYYGADSLKTRLCIQGREMMYALCEKYGIPHKNTGKWIVAQTNQQWEELVKVHTFAQTIGVPTQFISADEAAKAEPFVRAQVGILESPTSGIVDSHAYMQHLLGGFMDHGGSIAYHTTVTDICPTGGRSPNTSGYDITTRDGGSGAESSVTSSTVVNAAGLAACTINNMVFPAGSHPRHRTAYYAKGNYFSYSAASPRASRLIYPAPEPGHGGLGTHLTLDMSGALRFGPDVEWVDSPGDLAVNTARLQEAVGEIKKYMPGIREERLMPDYAGIRPKLGPGSAVATGKGFEDFYVREERDEGLNGFVNLLGIESPGLTASLAIAEEVEGLLYR